jgi:hypothetical protein
MRRAPVTIRLLMAAILVIALNVALGKGISRRFPLAGGDGLACAVLALDSFIVSCGSAMWVLIRTRFGIGKPSRILVLLAIALLAVILSVPLAAVLVLIWSD